MIGGTTGGGSVSNVKRGRAGERVCRGTHLDLFKRNNMIRRSFQIPLFLIIPMFPRGTGRRVRSHKHATSRSGPPGVVLDPLGGEMIIEHFADRSARYERVDKGDVV